MSHRDSFALDDVDTTCRDVEQQIDEMIFEQIDFIDIEESVVRAREQSGLEATSAVNERILDIDRAGNTIFSRAERKIDDGDVDSRGHHLAVEAARIAQSGGRTGRAVKRASVNHID